MKNNFNILLIAFLLVFASSCSKFEPLDRTDNSSDSYMIKNSDDATNTLNNKAGITDPEQDEDYDSDVNITDPEHDEDHDTDLNITDTDNEEDHDKENVNKG